MSSAEEGASAQKSFLKMDISIRIRTIVRCSSNGENVGSRRRVTNVDYQPITLTPLASPPHHPGPPWAFYQPCHLREIAGEMKEAKVCTEDLWSRYLVVSHLSSVDAYFSHEAVSTWKIGPRKKVRQKNKKFSLKKRSQKRSTKIVRNAHLVYFLESGIR